MHFRDGVATGECFAVRILQKRGRDLEIPPTEELNAFARYSFQTLTPATLYAIIGEREGRMDWKEALPEIITQPGSRIRFGEPLAKHTHFGIGGEATAYIEVSTVSELAALARFHKEWDVPIAVIGRGSNLLVSDNRF